MSLRQHIRCYLIKNAKNTTKSELYSSAAIKFDVNRKIISNYHRELQQEGLLADDVNTLAPANYPPSQVKKILDTFSQSGDNAEITKTVYKRIKTLDDLIEACEIDLTTWEIISWECNKWEVGRKEKSVDLSWHEGVVNGSVDDSGKVFVEPLFQVKAKLRLKKLDTDVNKQKDVLLKELFDASQPHIWVTDVSVFKPDIYSEPCPGLLELALFDVHFGKLAHNEESGEDYDLKIAAKRYKDAVEDLLSKFNIGDIERILLPIGQDMINVDNKYGTTTSGTPQDNDTRFYKTVRTVKNLLIETINKLAVIAPVDVVVVPGNHDEQTSFMIGEMLDAYYHKTDRVNIENSASLRKYYQYGTVGILLTHGDKEKHNALGMIFAAEKPALWADTTQRYIQIGHFHHNKKIEYLSNQDFQGFSIQILPSLSSNDAWHAGKGFLPLKQAKAFFYTKAEGLVAEVTHTAK